MSGVYRGVPLRYLIELGDDGLTEGNYYSWDLYKQLDSSTLDILGDIVNAGAMISPTGILSDVYGQYYFDIVGGTTLNGYDNPLYLEIGYRTPENMDESIFRTYAVKDKHSSYFITRDGIPVDFVASGWEEDVDNILWYCMSPDGKYVGICVDDDSSTLNVLNVYQGSATNKNLSVGGYTISAVGESSISPTNVIVASPINIPQDVNIHEMVCRGKASSGGNKGFRAALYDSSYNLRATSIEHQEYLFTTWYYEEIPCVNGTTVNSGDYYLAFWCQDSDTYLAKDETAGTIVTQSLEWDGNPFPDPLVPTSTLTGEQLRAYVIWSTPQR